MALPSSPQPGEGEQDEKTVIVKDVCHGDLWPFATNTPTPPKENRY